MKKKKDDMFGDMKDYAVGLTGFGLATAVGAGVQAQSPAGRPSVMGGFSTAASFTPIMGTMVGGKTVLKGLKKMKKKGGY